MQRIRVVRLVHGNGVFIVIDGNINTATNRQFDPGRGTAATSKVINDNFTHGPLPAYC